MLAILFWVFLILLIIAVIAQGQWPNLGGAIVPLVTFLLLLLGLSVFGSPFK